MKSKLIVLLLMALMLVPAVAVTPECAAAAQDPISRASNIPPRPRNAITGSQFARLTSGLPESERQQAALSELRRGNIPQFLRQLKPVQIDSDNGMITTVWVMPDYLAIGSDKDFLRIPLTLPSALAIAREFGCTLPTPHMVDAIYQQSAVKVKPRPLPAGPAMRSNAYYLRHQALIQEQLQFQRLGMLTAGQKKDVVLSDRLLTHPGRIAIYGWHNLDGTPIQPLSTVHGSEYADYSHGIRLVSLRVQVAGRSRSINSNISNTYFNTRMAGLLDKKFGQT